MARRDVEVSREDLCLLLSGPTGCYQPETFKYFLLEEGSVQMIRTVFLPSLPHTIIEPCTFLAVLFCGRAPFGWCPHSTRVSPIRFPILGTFSFLVVHKVMGIL